MVKYVATGGQKIASSDDGQAWTLRYTGADFIRSIAFGNDVWLAGSDGYVVRSLDGVSWSTVSVTGANTISALTYGGGQWVAVDWAGQIFTSPTGLVWTQQTSGIEGDDYAELDDVKWDGSQYIAVGEHELAAHGDADEAVLLTSPDGVTWTSEAVPSGWATIYTVDFGNGIYVVSGWDAGFGNGRIATGSAITSLSEVSGYDASDVVDLAFGGGKFVWSGSTRIVTSPDGVTWTDQTPTTAHSWDGIVYGDQWVAVGRDFSPAAVYAASSPDAITWTARTSQTANNDTQRVAYSPTRSGSFTANASIFAGSSTVAGSFSADAVVWGGRWQHHRLRDHFGVESDLYVTLNERIGPWEEGTPVHFVIDDLLNRMAALESATHTVSSFRADAYILAGGSWVGTGTVRGLTLANAVLRRTRTGSFASDAWINKGGHFTANAWIRARRTFTADAVLV